MDKKKLLWAAFTVVALAFALIQFVPGPEEVISMPTPPAQNQANQAGAPL